MSNYSHTKSGFSSITGFAVGKKGSEKQVVDSLGRMYLNFEPGNQFYVDSGSGSASNDGLTWATALATIDSAIGKCTANNGDIIWVAPGHTETITGTDITVDIAGVSVIGLGTGSLMPQIKHNHADAEVSIAADNVTWQGIRHSADVTGVKVAIEIEDGIDYCTVRGCVFDVVATGTDEFLVSIRTNDASNFALIEDNDFDMGIGGAVAAISFTKDTDSTVVRNNRAQGDYSTAVIEGITTLSTKVLIENNLLINGIAGNLGTKPCIQLLTGSTGTIRDNDCVCNLASMIAAVVADACMLFRNYYNEDVNPGTGTIMGTASADDG
jgi:hypothetical protein